LHSTTRGKEQGRENGKGGNRKTNTMIVGQPTAIKKIEHELSRGKRVRIFEIGDLYLNPRGYGKGNLGITPEIRRQATNRKPSFTWESANETAGESVLVRGSGLEKQGGQNSR